MSPAPAGGPAPAGPHRDWRLPSDTAVPLTAGILKKEKEMTKMSYLGSGIDRPGFSGLGWSLLGLGLAAVVVALLPGCNLAGPTSLNRDASVAGTVAPHGAAEGARALRSEPEVFEVRSVRRGGVQP